MSATYEPGDYLATIVIRRADIDPGPDIRAEVTFRLGTPATRGGLFAFLAIRLKELVDTRRDDGET